MPALQFETLVTGHSLVEGPRVDADERLYFSDPRRGGVYCRHPDGTIATVVPKRRGVGGIALHAEGGIVISGRNICHVRDGVTRIVFELSDTPGFNDLFTDADGHILVGSQRFSPFVGEPTPMPGEAYRILGEGRGEMLYDDVLLTNGIGLSPDATRLYHSDTTRNHVILHDLSPDGRCSNRRVFAELPRGLPDGLAVDEAGCVWVALFGGGGVARFTPEGRLDRRLAVPANHVASVSFGGADRRDLYIATADNTENPALRGSIFRTRVDVAGLVVPLATI